MTNLRCPYCDGRLQYIGEDPDNEYDEETGQVENNDQTIYDCMSCNRQLFYPSDWQPQPEPPLDPNDLSEGDYNDWLHDHGAL